MKTVYLCGGINGLTDDEAKGWRETAKAAFAGRLNVLDPMRRDYRGKEDANVAEIVHGDLADICLSNVLLVNAARPSWGTAMEVYFAATTQDRGPRKAIIAVVPDGPVSPWLRYYCDCLCRTLDEAIDLILRRFG